jgi:hypothetical protein
MKEGRGEIMAGGAPRPASSRPSSARDPPRSRPKTDPLPLRLRKQESRQLLHRRAAGRPQVWWRCPASRAGASVEACRTEARRGVTGALDRGSLGRALRPRTPGFRASRPAGRTERAPRSGGRSGRRPCSFSQGW